MRSRTRSKGDVKKRKADSNKVAENVRWPKNEEYLQECSQSRLVPNFPKKRKMATNLQETISVMSELTGNKSKCARPDTRCYTDVNCQQQNTGAQNSQNSIQGTGQETTDHLNTSQVSAGSQTANTLPTAPPPSPTTVPPTTAPTTTMPPPSPTTSVPPTTATKTTVPPTSPPSSTTTTKTTVPPTTSPTTATAPTAPSPTSPTTVPPTSPPSSTTTLPSTSPTVPRTGSPTSHLVPVSVAETETSSGLPCRVETVIPVQTTLSRENTEILSTSIPDDVPEIHGPNTLQSIEENTMSPCLSSVPERKEHTTSVVDSDMDIDNNTSLFSPLAHNTTGTESIGKSEAVQEGSVSDEPIDTASLASLLDANKDTYMSESAPVRGEDHEQPGCSKLKETNADHDVSDSCEGTNPDYIPKADNSTVVPSPMECSSEVLSPTKPDTKNEEQLFDGNYTSELPCPHLDCPEQVTPNEDLSSQPNTWNSEIVNNGEKLTLTRVDVDKDVPDVIADAETTAGQGDSNCVLSANDASTNVEETNLDEIKLNDDANNMDSAGCESETFSENNELNSNKAHVLDVMDNLEKPALASKEITSPKFAISNFKMDDRAVAKVGSPLKTSKEEQSEVSIQDNESDIDMTDSQLCEAINIEESNNQLKTLEKTRRQHLEGRKILHNLIVDLSFLNKLLLRTKREIEYAKRNRQSQSSGKKIVAVYGDHRRLKKL